MFHCDKALFQEFLAVSGWPVVENFCGQALAHALIRQAVGLAQHHTMDVFKPIAAAGALQDMETLDELATELFGFAR